VSVLNATLSLTPGEVTEWLKVLLSKSSEPATVPRVRIPPSPPNKMGLLWQAYFIW
jgi:hypothetical protein